MDFVWIYAKKFSAFYSSGVFNELDYSIRSVRKNFQGDARCFVVGDDPGLDVIHVKAPPLVTEDPIMKQPTNLDLLNKLEVIIADKRINEEFILMYDDVYILQPTTKEELMTCYGRAEVGNPTDYIMTRNGGTHYKRLWVSTYDYIVTYRMLKGLKTYDWETHLPRFLEKTKLNKLINDLSLKLIPKIPTSLYNAFYNDHTELIPEGLQSDIWSHVPGMDFAPHFACKYMNIGDDIIVPDFLKHMYEHFGR